jgi:hypothetical protein
MFGWYVFTTANSCITTSVVEGLTSSVSSLIWYRVATDVGLCSSKKASTLELVLVITSSCQIHSKVRVL